MIRQLMHKLQIIDDFRKNIWPLVTGNKQEDIPDSASVEEIKHHQYYNQVVLDVKRILKRFPPGKTFPYSFSVHHLSNITSVFHV